MTNSASPIQVTFEPTPNPAAMKFVFSSAIAQDSSEFLDVQSAERSPLALKVFGFPWVSSVFVGTNFVTITKQDWVDWKVLAQPLSGLLAEHVSSGQPVYIDFTTATDESELDSDLVKRIKRVLANEIKPVVALDGGDIAFVKFENEQLFLQMKGACSSCPSSQATLKDGIEVRMRQAFPEIKEVLAI